MCDTVLPLININTKDKSVGVRQPSFLSIEAAAEAVDVSLFQSASQSVLQIYVHQKK